MARNYNFQVVFFKFPAPTKIPRLLDKFPKSQVGSQNPKIWGKIPSSGGLVGFYTPPPPDGTLFGKVGVETC